MRKRNVINLIRYHVEGSDESFRREAYMIAKDFELNGDAELSQYILALLSDENTFVPQEEDLKLTFYQKVEPSNNLLPLPEEIKNDILGIINAIHKKCGVNKFLFEGAPGTGKTETAKHLARILNRDLYTVQFDSVIDSKLGQTLKNISALFEELKTLPHPEKIIVLFDEIDALALDRVNENDLREMGRATSMFLKELENSLDSILFIATTNMYQKLNKALIRRFDKVIHFNRYSEEDLIEIADLLLKDFSKNNEIEQNQRLFHKILKLLNPIPYPGDLKNIIKSSVAFSNSNNKSDYLRILFHTIYSEYKNLDLKKLQEMGFTVREIKILTGTSKSTDLEMNKTKKFKRRKESIC